MPHSTTTKKRSALDTVCSQGLTRHVRLRFIECVHGQVWACVSGEQKKREREEREGEEEGEREGERRKKKKQKNRRP
jgi:hypothetical protein